MVGTIHAATCTIREAVERFGLDRATVRRLRKRLVGKQLGWRHGHGWTYTLRDLEEALEDDRASQWRRSWPKPKVNADTELCPVCGAPYVRRWMWGRCMVCLTGKGRA